VTELLAVMLAALQRAATLSNTNMFGFKVLIRSSEILLLSLGCHTRDGPLFGGAAVKVVEMSSTIELGAADSHTLRDVY
jgi:hypothetical protein